MKREIPCCHETVLKQCPACFRQHFQYPKVVGNTVIVVSVSVLTGFLPWLDALPGPWGTRFSLNVLEAAPIEEVIAEAAKKGAFGILHRWLDIPDLPTESGRHPLSALADFYRARGNEEKAKQIEAGMPPEKRPSQLVLTFLEAREAGALTPEQRTTRLRLLEKARDIDPKQSVLWYDIGLTLLELGRATEAVAAFERARSLDPYFLEAISNQGVALIRAGRLDEGETCLEKARSINSRDYTVLYNIGSLALKKGNLEKAQEFAKTLFRYDQGRALGSRLNMMIKLHGRR